MLKKTEDFLGRYGRICPIARVLSPVFTGAFYVGLAVAALLLITALIVLFVNVDVEKMLLPPDMKALRDASGAVTEYSLDLGNGIRIVSPASAVTLSHIKPSSIPPSPPGCCFCWSPARCSASCRCCCGTSAARRRSTRKTRG